MKLVSWSFLVLLFISCKEEKMVTHADLTGRWNFSKATRNGKETRMLDQAFFVFHPDNSITSNLFQTDERKTFELADNRLKVSGTDAFEMEITNFLKDTMELEGTMGTFAMQFLLVRSADTIPAE